MGICPSRCGEKQPSAVATEAALETKLSPSPYDPNHSLKRFLHLNQDSKTSATSTPRISLVKSTAIPHSSELFSLPESELQLRSSFAVSPTETPKRRAPTDVTLLSSHLSSKSSSKGRSNNKRIRPATRFEHVDSGAHQRLVDAIARLERFSDAGKTSFLELRGSEDVAPKSSFGERLSKPAVRSRHVRHYQLPLPKSTMARAPSSHPPLGNPVPLDTTLAATDFLRETFVSLIEEPRKLEHPKSTLPATLTNRSRLEDIDGEEMFSFEFGPSGDRVRLKQSPVRKKSVSLQRLFQSGAQGSSSRRFAGEEMDMANIELGKKSSCSTLQPGEVSGVENRTARSRNSVESGMKSLRKEEAVRAARRAQDAPNLVTMGKARSPRLALRLKALKGLRRGRLSQSLDSMESSLSQVDLEIFRNQPGATPTAAASRLSTVAAPNKHATEALSMDAKRVETEPLPVVSSRLEPLGCEPKLDLKLKEPCCTGIISDTSTPVELAAAETTRQPQEVASLVEDVAIPLTGSAKTNRGELASNNLDKLFETKK